MSPAFFAMLVGLMLGMPIGATFGRDAIDRWCTPRHKRGPIASLRSLPIARQNRRRS